MKTAVPSTAKDAQSPASRSHRPVASTRSGRLAQLAKAVNQSPLVQAQMNLSRMMQQSAESRQLQVLGAGINAIGAPPVVQRKLALKIDKPQPPWYEPISILIDEYNALLQKAESAVLFNEPERRLALVALQSIESWTYAWFRKLNVPDIYMTQYGPLMSDFLNSIKNERERLVAWSMKKWDKDPPVANLKSLSLEQQKVVTEIWARLVKDKQMIQGNDEFRLRVLTDFSRLLETETGRTLVGTIVSAGNVLQIQPQEGGKFAASPDNGDLEEIQAIEEPDEEERKYFVKFDFTMGQSVEQRKLALHNVRTENPKARGLVVTSSKGVKYFRFNKGVSSTLTIPPEALKDASLLPASRGLGVHDEEILAPSFINLGHELGHVLRSLQGLSAGVYGGKELIKHAFPDVNVEMREEEFFNIDAVENQLRQQSGLSRRKEHTDWTANVTIRLMKRLLEIRGIVATLREAGKDGTIVLKAEVLETLNMIEARCDELSEPIRQFSKKGGSPTELQKTVASLSDKARELSSLLPVSEEVEEAPRKGEFIKRITFDSEDRIDLVMSGEHLRAAKEIAIDGSVPEKWIGPLVQALKKKATFSSKRELSRFVSANLPEKYERAAEEIASYLAETEL